jgi:hypothetical protein
LIGAPELHHWHHDRDRRAGNYANISPMMDIIFGTYKCPDHEPQSFGIEEPAAKNYFWHMIMPLLPAWAAKHVPKSEPKPLTEDGPRGFEVVVRRPEPEASAEPPPGAVTT